MTEVLVTGGAGFIGSNFVRHALSAHPDWRADLADAIHVLSHLFLGGPPPHRGRRCTAIAGCEASCEVVAGG